MAVSPFVSIDTAWSGEIAAVVRTFMVKVAGAKCLNVVMLTFPDC